MADHVIVVAVDIDALVLECNTCGTWLTVWEHIPDQDERTIEALVELAKSMPHKPIDTTATEIRGEI